MTEISVVIPTYNNKYMLDGLLQRLSRQNFRKTSYEIIVVDDGSTDGTEKVAKKYKVVYIRQKNSGPAKARNTGILKAKGRIIAFTDDDCLPDLNWLKELKNGFKRGIVGVEGMTITDGKKIYPDSHFIKNIKGGMYVTCNMAFLASYLKKSGFDETYRFPNREDSDLAFRMLSAGSKIVFFEKAVVVHRVLKYSMEKMLKRKLYFESDILLFKKQKKLYKDRIGMPFERFTPFYILFAVLSFMNPLFLAGIFLTSLAEMFYRRYSFSIPGFAKFLIVQALGSFLILFAVFRGCARYRVSPFSFL